MFTEKRIKPNGRQLWPYSNAPMQATTEAPSPFAEPLNANPH